MTKRLSRFRPIDTRWLYVLDDLSPCAKSVCLYVIYQRDVTEWNIDLTVKELADATGYSLASIYKALRSLNNRRYLFSYKSGRRLTFQTSLVLQIFRSGNNRDKRFVHRALLKNKVPQ